MIRVCYTLTGPLDDLRLPPSVSAPERRDNLWQESCLEFFLAEHGAEEYWEVNLSPCGHWNVYHFDRYRENMRQEGNVVSLPCRASRSRHAFTLEAILDPRGMGITGKSLLAGVSAVLLSRDNVLSYWALAHPAEKPDFHLRKSFLLAL